MQTESNTPPKAATDEPAVPAILPSDLPLADISDRLSPMLIDSALDALADPAPNRARRRDGWTPERVRTFLNALAECGVVDDAARAAGMSRTSAYALRRRAEGRAFHVAWNAAELLARRNLSGALVSRALHGCKEVIVRDGEVWAERHRFDNRLTLAVLQRLDKRATAIDDEARSARLVAEEFEQFVELVCDGGEGAADFLASRVANDRFVASREARTLSRADNYRRYGVGLPDEIDVSDLDETAQESWTEEQSERARRAGLFVTPDFELPAHEIEPEPIREPHQTWVCKQCQKTEYTADDYFRWRKPDDEDDLPIEPPPAPAATASAVVSAASRALYDPASGNPPPPGWVAPGR